MVLTVCGRVGLVELGRTYGSETTVMMSGACPPCGALGVVRVDGAPGDGGEGVADEARLVQGVGVDGELGPGLLADGQAGVDDGGGRAPVLVDLEPERAAAELGVHGLLDIVLPLPSRPMLTGKVSSASNILAVCQGPGVTVVALVPSAGPVPPPTRVVTPVARACSTTVGEMKWTWASTAAGGDDPAVADDDLGLGADDEAGVDAVHGVGVRRLCRGR